MDGQFRTVSRRRTSPTIGRCDPAAQSALGRGPNGRRLCRICGQEVEKRQKFWCKGCAHDYLMRTNPGYVRQQVFARDKGVCADCGLDTQALLLEVEARSRAGGLYWRHLLQERGFDGGKSLWEADHIVPVVEGGGECGLENYQTLCQICHKKATRELRGRLKHKRREERAELITQERQRTETLALPLDENLNSGS